MRCPPVLLRRPPVLLRCPPVLLLGLLLALPYCTPLLLSPQPFLASLSAPPRLPVWPVFPGVVLSALDLLGQGPLARRLEDEGVGGRVAPMQLPPEASPFVLLVHHRHRFNSRQPVRPLSRLLLPEGFPAHPHRGFETVTMCLKGGMVHRDSLGLKQSYGEGRGGDTQWLTAGGGLLHEEMWNGDEEQELYQLWVDLPAKSKLDPPSLSVLSPRPAGQPGVEEVPRPPGQPGASVSIRHVSTGPEPTTLPLDPSHETVLVYVRRGSAAGVSVSSPAPGASAFVPVHSCAQLNPRAAASLTFSSDKPCDLLLLTGRPLNQPVVASGSFVMDSQQGIDDAVRDYQAGRMGPAFDHKLSDEEWREAVERHWRAVGDTREEGWAKQ